LKVQAYQAIPIIEPFRLPFSLVSNRDGRPPNATTGNRIQIAALRITKIEKLGVANMIRTVCLAGAAMAMLSSTALADYYVVQEKKTKECKVVETRPTETTWVQVGPLAFKTRDEAEKQIKVICKKD
jgi:hypothetical protein